MSPLLTALALAATPAPQSCSFETAVPADVREMARDPEKWFDRCVRLDGFVAGHSFYQDVAGLYRASAADALDRPNEGWLGLYFRSRGNWGRHLRRASVAGVVGDCQRSYKAAQAAATDPNTLIMMLGYCHYRGGLTIKRTDVRFGGRVRFTRPVGEKARAAFGDLIPVSADNPLPAEVEAIVATWRGAFRAGDLAVLRRLVRPYDFTEKDFAKRFGRIDPYLLGTSGAFVPLREGALEPVFLKERIDRQRAEYDQGDWFACFCKSGDCSGSWPIAAADAKALKARPYACLRIHDPNDGSTGLRLGLETADNGLVEPQDRVALP